MKTEFRHLSPCLPTTVQVKRPKASNNFNFNFHLRLHFNRNSQTRATRSRPTRAQSARTTEWPCHCSVAALKGFAWARWLITGHWTGLLLLGPCPAPPRRMRNMQIKGKRCRWFSGVFIWDCTRSRTRTLECWPNKRQLPAAIWNLESGIRTELAYCHLLCPAKNCRN